MKPAPVPAPFDIDAEVERLGSLPPLEQRAAFFATLESLPPHSLARIQLGQVVPRALPKTCGGPWYEKEWNTLAGFSYPRREHSSAEVAATADHAEASALVEEMRSVWTNAVMGTRTAERAAASIDEMNLSRRDEWERRQAALRDARNAEREAFERLEEAMSREVQLRVHQPEHRRAAGRNFLRFLGRKVSQ